jgi:hypothetical protein
MVTESRKKMAARKPSKKPVKKGKPTRTAGKKGTGK